MYIDPTTIPRSCWTTIVVQKLFEKTESTTIQGFLNLPYNALSKKFEPIPKVKTFLFRDHISRPQGNKEFRTHRKEKRQELDIMTNLCEL